MIDVENHSEAALAVAIRIAALVVGAIGAALWLTGCGGE